MNADRQKVLQETTVVREKAESLLRGLLEAKMTSERYLTTGCTVDPMKKLTGRSSMDNAIASTRRMIESLDRTLLELKHDLSDEDIELLQRK